MTAEARRLAEVVGAGLERQAERADAHAGERLRTGALPSRPAAATTLRTMRSRCSSLTAITPRIIEKS